jgi:ATP-dependent DNA ligase
MIGIDPAVRRSWRPQEFGSRRAQRIDDPLVEPLWRGQRVLAHVDAGHTLVVGRDGAEVAVPALAMAVTGATLAMSAVLDGYVTDDLNDTGEGAAVDIIEVDDAATHARQLLLGRRQEPPDRAAVRLAYAEHVGEAPVGSSVALVVTDLLELDGDVLLDVPLLERKRLLESVIAADDAVRIGIHVRPPIESWVRTWRALGFTGLVFKEANGRYRPGERNDGWSIAPIPPR